MRILFITAYYPPCNYGWGYMNLCARVADEMHTRGHAVSVLASRYRNGPETRDYPVHRLLELDPDWHSRKPAFLQFFLDRRRRERDSMAHYRRVVDDFRPDIVFIWHGQGLSRRMLQLAEGQDPPVAVYYLANYLPETADDYLCYWTARGRSSPARWMRAAVAPLAQAMLRRDGRPVRLAFTNTISVSEHVRERLLSRSLIGANAVTIPNGSDLEALEGLHRAPRDGRPLRLVVAGRISPEKGVHTVITALEQLGRRGRAHEVQLTLIGDGPERYVSRIRQLVVENGLQELVRFQAQLPLDAYRRLLAQQDVLLFPSTWDEPLSTTMIEAMAMGLLVIGTGTGGSGEVLIDEKTGLAFTPGDGSQLADALERVLDDPGQLEAVSARGEAHVRERYALSGMLDAIEVHLFRLLRTEGPP